MRTLSTQFADAAVDTERGRVYTLLEGGISLAQYASPAMILNATYQVDRSVFRLAVDASRGKLYALRAASVRRAGPLRVGEDAELLVFNTSELKPKAKVKVKGKAKLARTEPAGRLKLEGAVAGLTLSPDGKSLYYFDTKGNRLARVETATLQPDGEAVLFGAPTALAMTPDGKLLYAATTKDKVGYLEVFGSGLKALRRHKLPLIADEVVATNDQLVWVAGLQDANRVDVLYDEADRLKQLHRQRGSEAVSLRLAPDGKGVFLIPRRGAPFDVIYYPLGPGRMRGAAVLLPIAERSARGTAAVVTPDGKHLLLPGGVFRLPELGKP